MHFFKRLLPILLALAATGLISVLAVGIGAYYYLAPALPSADTMRDVKLQIPMKVYTRDGRLIQQIGEKRRNPVTFEQIPPVVANAFLAAEDDRFFEHPGFDYQGIARAAFNLLLTGSRAQGGSTITQQLARAYFLTRDRTFVRKAKELILALQIEQSFEKQEILSLYLNKIFLGQRSYGVAAAAEVYFGKELKDVNVAEAAMLAGLPKAPSSLNPVTNPTRALERRSYVLRRMLELGYIDTTRYEEAKATPLVSKLHGAKVDMTAPYVAAMASRKLIKMYGQEEAFTGGYKVVTTIDATLQLAARDALRKGLLDYDYRHGYRGPLDTLELDSVAPSLFDDPATGDAELQAALKSYQTFGGLELGVVLTLNEDNSADVYVKNLGRISVPWLNLQRSPYINENQVGPTPKTVGELLQAGNIIQLGRNAEGAWQLSQTPIAQGSVVSMDPYDGALVALTGGFDFFASKYNRATQTARQPGSSMKPFIYSAALANGFTAATLVNDAPISIDDSTLETTWRPNNFDNKFNGPTRLREGLIKSVNLVAIRTLRSIGFGPAIEHLKPFGFPGSALPRDSTLALGSGGASPLDMVGAYAAIANSGHYLSPYIVERIEDAGGNVVYQAEPLVVCNGCTETWFDGRETEQTEALPDFVVVNDEPAAEAPLDLDAAWTDDPVFDAVDSEVPAYASVDEMLASAADWRPDASETPLFFENFNNAKRIVDAANAYIIYDMMRDVVRRGTGRRAMELGRNDLAGKTGTTNDGVDVWFNGFNRNLVAVAWLGFDDNRSLGRREQGGRTALPMWKDFMEVALRGQADAMLPRPDDVITVRISAETGELAGPYDNDTIFEIFKAGTEPQRGSTMPGFDDNTDNVEDIFEDSDIF